MTTRHLLLSLLLSAAVALSAGHASNSAVLDVKGFTDAMQKHFQMLEHARHPKTESKPAWINARTYMQDRFKNLGLSVELQCFNTTVLVAPEQDEEVTGCNVIGTSMGTSMKNLLVVGAHYDSSGVTTDDAPLKDNGVGAAVLLEVAEALEGSIRWKGFARNFTTIFVAFDLNTKEQFPISSGRAGSHIFVREWLTPKLQKERRSLNGSFILDSIASYNTDSNSQTVAADLKAVFPDAYERISNSSSRGDFLAAITLDSVQGAGELVRDFAGHYRMDRQSRPYRLQEMITDQLGSGDTLEMVNKQAALYFWTNKPALPSVLLTDTGKKRSSPMGEQCGAAPGTACDFSNPARMQFVYHTYRALAETIISRQTTYVGLTTASAGISGISVLTLLLSTAAALLLTRC